MSNEPTKALKLGDLVTLDNQGSQVNSNVVVVVGQYEGKYLVTHPMAQPYVMIKEESELNRTSPVPKSNTERCIDFLLKHKEYLNYEELSDIQAICYYFVANRKFTGKLIRTINHYCGKIAKIKLENSLPSAINLVMINKGILDEFNRSWFEALSDYYYEKVDDRGRRKYPSPKHINSMFNQAGWVMAQLETYSVPLSHGGET